MGFLALAALSNTAESVLDCSNLNSVFGPVGLGLLVLVFVFLVLVKDLQAVPKRHELINIYISSFFTIVCFGINNELRIKTNYLLINYSESLIE
jgi:hypothetical protein